MTASQTITLGGSFIASVEVSQWLGDLISTFPCVA